MVPNQLYDGSFSSPYIKPDRVRSINLIEQHGNKEIREIIAGKQKPHHVPLIRPLKGTATLRTSIKYRSGHFMTRLDSP